MVSSSRYKRMSATPQTETIIVETIRLLALAELLTHDDAGASDDAAKTQD